jgi:cytochrome c oxidase subunit 3
VTATTPATTTATTTVGAAHTRGADAGERTAAARDVDATIGMTILLGAWVMLFAALFLAYGVVRVQANEWPPFGAARLPLVVPGLNTLVLLASSAVLRRGLGRARRGDPRALLPAAVAAALLGVGFLGAQLAMWRAMLARGLFPGSGVYGSVFYALTGFHALHVLGGVVALAALAIHARVARQREGAPLRALRLTALYWDFVAVVWVAMYLAVYCL